MNYIKTDWLWPGVKLDTALVRESPCESVTQGLLYNHQMSCIRYHILLPPSVNLQVVKQKMHYGGICSAKPGSVVRNDIGWVVVPEFVWKESESFALQQQSCDEIAPPASSAPPPVGRARTQSERAATSGRRPGADHWWLRSIIRGPPLVLGGASRRLPQHFLSTSAASGTGTAPGLYRPSCQTRSART